MTIQKNRLSEESYQANFQDIHPPYRSEESAVREAHRCINCFDAPCTKWCPSGIDIPGFIRRIASGDDKGAARTIFTSNIMGVACSKVCPVERLCEGVCVYNLLKEKPVAIARLQRYATEKALRRNWKLFEKGRSNGKRVAVIGAGPAGLACAHTLALNGVAVTIFEKEARPGGLMTYGIAAYKVTTEACRQEVDYILSIGSIELFCEKELGTDFTINELQLNYDAVFLSPGMGETRHLGIPGETLKGVYDALSFVRRIRTEDRTQIEVGDKVVVIGLGMTAIDAATQAKRLGAGEVTLVYRRSEVEKPCSDRELEIALLDGCRLLWLTAPVGIQGKEGKVTGLLCSRMKLGEKDSTGRRMPVETGETFELECDMVIKAVGQEPLVGLFSGKDITDKNGKIVLDEHLMTGIPGVFAGGDAVNGGKEVVHAVQAGKEGATAILDYLAR